MHSLPFNQQLQTLSQRANTRQINANDRYLEVYPELLAGMQALLPLTRQNLALAAHAVFGWMPTQLRVDMGQINAALPIVNRVLPIGAQITTNDIALLASTFQAANGNSVVAASKILHFLAPERFPIWDRLVAKIWGLSSSGPEAAENYHGFLQACLQFADHPHGQQACAAFRQRLAQAGYTYPMSDMRVLELIFFLPKTDINL